MGLLMGFLSNWSGGITMWLVDSSIKIAIVSVMLLILCRLLRKSSSRLRYGVCVLALVGMGCVPIISLFSPGVSLDVDWFTSPLEDVVVINHSKSISEDIVNAPSWIAEDDLATVASSKEPFINNETASSETAGFEFHLEWLIGIWLIGTLVIGCYFLLGLLRVQWFACRDCQPADSRWHDALSKIKGELSLRFVPKLICSPRTASPLTWGIVRPIVLLPVQALLWTEDRIRLTLIHESLHIKRGDWVVQLLGCFICAIQWFNPLVWIAYRRLSIEREQSCDEQVVAQGILPSQYASHLLETARQLASRRWMPQMTLAMAHHCRLEERILALRQHANSARRGVVLASTAVAVMSALLVTLIGVRLTDKPLAPLQPILETKPILTDKNSNLSDKEYSRKDERIPKNIKFMMATVTMDAGSQNAFSQSVKPQSSGNINLSWTKGDSIVEFISIGEVRFNDWNSAIAALSTDASVQLIEDNGDISQKLLITSGDSQKLIYQYEVQGHEQKFDTKARAWMSELLYDAAIRTKSLTQ